MKISKKIAVMIFVASLSHAPVYAEEVSDWYIAGAGTLSLLNDSHTMILDLPIPGGFAETEYQLDTGFGAQVALGRRIGNARLEIEGGYSENDADSYLAIVPPTGEITAQGGHKVWRAMANTYYDFGSGAFRPYIGAGIGYADIKVRLFAARAPFPNETPFLILDDNAGEFVYQAMAGAAYQVSPRVAVTTQYRWLSAGKVHLRDLGGFKHVREHDGHNFDVGVRVNF